MLTALHRAVLGTCLVQQRGVESGSDGSPGLHGPALLSMTPGFALFADVFGCLCHIGGRQAVLQAPRVIYVQREMGHRA